MMGVGIYVLRDYDLYSKIANDFPDREVIFLNDIYLIPEVLNAYDKNVFIGNMLNLSYLQSVLKMLREDKLRWHKNVYIDDRDLKLFSQDPSILINGYIRLLESNNHLDEVIIVRRISESLSRRELISGGIIEDYVSNIPILRETDKCISLDKCDICKGVCPYDAIKWSKPPEIVDDECIECGYCINSCPSLIFTYPMLPLTSFELFLKTLRWSGDKNNILLVINDSKRVDFYGKMFNRYQGTGITILYISNALYFSQYHIILSIAHGYNPVIMVDENVPGYLKYHQMIEEFNNLLDIKITLVNSVLPDLSDLPQFNGYVEDFVSTDHIRMFRSILRRLKKRDKYVSVNLLNLFHLSIEDGKCTLCEACVRKCPSGALKIEKNMYVRLYFNPVECIGCRMCELNCPEDAMELKRGINSYKYIQDVHEVIIEDKMAYCLNCGAPIGPERIFRALEKKMRIAGVEQENIKSIRYCKKCKSKFYFKDLYGR